MTDTTDIKALRELLCHEDLESDYHVGVTVTTLRLLLSKYDQLEAERQRAHELVTIDVRREENTRFVEKRLAEAEAELAEMKGEQVTVAYCQTTRDKIKHVAMQALSHALKNKQLEMADIHALSMMLMPLLTVPQKPTTEQMIEWLEGMEVSVDVSTGDSDHGNRLFGKVTEVSELDGAKNGVILLVQEPEANFTAPQNPVVLDDDAVLAWGERNYIKGDVSKLRCMIDDAVTAGSIVKDGE